MSLKVDTGRPVLGGLLTPLLTADGRGPICCAELFKVPVSSDALSEATETYCRGNDLITRYPASEADPIDREIYWRLIDDHDDSVTSVETIYSLQTDLLDSSPQPSVPSVFLSTSRQWFQQNDNGGESDRWNECSFEDACFAAGEGGGRIACVLNLENDVSVLQTVFPADLRGIEVSMTDEQTEVHWHLKSSFLEKGVIRRLRMLTVLSGTGSSDHDLLAAADRFYVSDLPLTV